MSFRWTAAGRFSLRKKVSWYHYFISIDIVKSFFDCEVCVMGAKKRLPVGIEFFDELIQGKFLLY